MADENLDIRMRLRGAREAQAGADRVAGAVSKVGSATKKTGQEAEVSARKLGMFERGLQHMRGGAKNVAGLGVAAEKSTHRLHGLVGGAVALGGAFAGFHAAESAIHTTEELGHSVLRLSNIFNLSEADATRWAAQASVRGIATRQLGMSFTSLSKQVQSAAGGSKSATKMFGTLGLSTRALGAHAKDTEWILRRVSDGLHNLPAGTARAAAGSKLFGRGWLALSPLLTHGSKAMTEQLLLADKYGVSFGGHAAEATHKLTQAMRASKMATLARIVHEAAAAPMVGAAGLSA